MRKILPGLGSNSSPARTDKKTKKNGLKPSTISATKINVMRRIQSAIIIDDDEDLSQLLAGILEDRQIHVYVAHSLKEAENFLSYLKPSVIFLDNSFPEGLGVNFIHKIKMDNQAGKIIMITAEESDWIYKKAMDEGVSYFLKKPFSKKSIDTLVDRMEGDT